MALQVEIDQEDITYAKTFLSQYLGDYMPEADFSDGTGLQDLVVKAMSYYFAFLRSELTKVKTLRSLKQLYDLEDDEEIKEAVDDIISNFLINRGDGSKSKINVTIRFSQRVDTYIPTSNKFNRDGAHNFLPLQPYFINKEDLIETVDVDGKVYYEMDVILEAENIGTEYEVQPGNFVSWDIFNQYIVSVRNTQAASGGDSVESNRDYIDRADDAITVRNLINPRSIRTVLLELFKDDGLKDVVAIGYGDAEMLRDAINTNVTFITVDVVHIGNHQDIYVTLPLLENQTYQAVTETEEYLGEPDRPGSIMLPQYPIYKIHSVKDTLSGLDLPYTLFIRDHRYYYTKEQEAYIVLNSGLNDVDVTVTYDTISNFDLIHTYLRNPDERTILANSLARAKIPVYLEIDIPYRQIQGQPDLDVTAATTTVLDYLNSLASSDQLDVDSLTKIIHTSYGQSIIIQTPLILKATVYYPDGTTQDFYTENILTVPTHTTLGVTERNCAYFCSESYITFTKLN